MKRYSILHPFFLSVFSKSLYRDVGQNWKGICFTYLLLVLLVTWLPTMVKDYISAARREPAVKNFVNQFPRITISNGEVSCDAPMPYIIKDSETNKPAIIIDTTGQTTNLDNTPAEFLLTKNAIIYKDDNALTGATRTESIDLSMVKSLYLDRDRVAGFVRLFKYGIFPLMYLISLVYRLVQVLIYGAIGLLFARMLQVDLSYKTLVRLSVIAITPALLLATVVDFFNLPMGLYLCGGGLVFFLISMGYLYFAVKANAPEPSEPPPLAA